tara:strand:+ start:296 stop:517 length:222 start_codon:yes stop_codon:yes gene_type:complete
MNQNIQKLFSLLDSDQQKQLIKVLAEHYKKEARSIRNNWFSGKYKQVPKNNQTEVLRILQRSIELFNLTPQLK